VKYLKGLDIFFNTDGKFNDKIQSLNHIRIPEFEEILTKYREIKRNFETESFSVKFRKLPVKLARRFGKLGIFGGVDGGKYTQKNQKIKHTRKNQKVKYTRKNKKVKYTRKNQKDKYIRKNQKVKRTQKLKK
jgi:hypothetical protein